LALDLLLETGLVELAFAEGGDHCGEGALDFHGE
jgi:hypothetical protein